MTSNPSMDEAPSVIPGVPHRWTALTVALTAIGFIVFWPLGLAMIAYVLWGEKIWASARSSEGMTGGLRRQAEEFGRNFKADFAKSGFQGPRRTGNAAFDTWREAELRRIDEERRKLDETTAAFEAHLRAERGQQDNGRQREEFDRFMAGRGQQG